MPRTAGGTRVNERRKAKVNKRLTASGHRMSPEHELRVGMSMKPNVFTISDKVNKPTGHLKLGGKKFKEFFHTVRRFSSTFEDNPTPKNKIHKAKLKASPSRRQNKRRTARLREGGRTGVGSKK